MSDPSSPPAPSALRLVVVSFLALFYEMVVIRWLPAVCPVFGYYSNLPLITAVFWIGLGCILARRRISLWPAFGPLVLAFVFLATTTYFQKVTRVGWTGEEMWPAQQVFAWLGPVLFHASFLGLLLLSGLPCLPVGQEMGRAFQGFRPLAAYSLNLFGSLLGVWGYAVLAFEQSSAVPWFAVVGLAALAVGRWRTWPICIVCIAASLWIVHTCEKGGFWSPYYWIQITDLTHKDTAGRDRTAGAIVAVNTNCYETMINFGIPIENEFPDLAPFRTYYEEPYRRVRPKTVLIVGSGAGNDVAAALRYGAESIDAVEIDPQILRVGREMHPEHPYSDRRVHAYNDDARSFFKKTKQKYDLIIFGFLDSHVLFSALGRLRLDNYVYTVEGLQEAKEHLAEGGVVHMSFTAYREWAFQRFAVLFHAVFGDDFVALPVGPTLAYVFAGGKGVSAWDEGKPTGWTRLILPQDEVPDLPTDDWPFLYKKDRTFPREYAQMLAVLLAAYLLLMWPTMRKSGSWDGFMASMGAAFLLLEVRGLATLALLFGSTWIVNAVVISMVLVMALLGNLLASFRTGPPARWMHFLLWGAVLLNWAVPSSAFLGTDFMTRCLLGGGLVALPLFFAGFLFASAFRESKDVEGALGSNLIGAVAGGMSEYSSMVTGFRALLLLALFYYLAAFLVCEKRRAR